MSRRRRSKSDLSFLALLRAMPGPDERLRATLTGADFEILVHHAARHGLAAVVEAALTAAGIDLPSRSREALKLQAFGSAAVSSNVRLLLFRALDALGAQGIKPVLLKGYGLALRYYPDPLVRATSDVDLLIEREHLASARSALLALGFKSKVASDAFYPPRYQHHFSLSGPSGTIELHFRLMTTWGAVWEPDSLLSRAVPAFIEGRPVRYLQQDDELVYLALHAANHMLGRLGWLYDLKLILLARPSLDISRIVYLARQTGMPSPAFYAFDAAQRLVGAPVPRSLLAALAPNPLRMAASRRIFSGERLLEGFLPRHRGIWAASKLLLADSPSRMALFGLRRLHWNVSRAAGSLRGR